MGLCYDTNMKCRAIQQKSKNGGTYMKNQNKKRGEIMKKMIKHMVDAEIYGWPPQCVSFLYQPVRPPKAGNPLPDSIKKIHK